MLAKSIEDARRNGREWLFGHAAPLWASNGVLSDDMFAERLSIHGEPIIDLDRRLRVQARQIYSFCAIGSLGWSGPWKSVATKALDRLLSHGFREDGFCIHRFSNNGEVVDRRRDLYDHAFMLFALGHAGQSLDRADALLTAARLRDMMMEMWWRPESGFWEGEVASCPPYRQNPHMHMLEAALVNYEATKDQAWKSLCERLTELATTNFVDADTGALTEYFDKNWNKLSSSDSSVVEPGHCFEWAWLLETAPDGQRQLRTAERLVDFARSFGVNRDLGVAINEIDLTGKVLDASARLWPQTERLKAAAIRYRRTGQASEANEIVDAYNGLSLFLDVPGKGAWRDKLEGDGTWVDEDAPASSFYHIVCALVELDKCGA